MEYCVDGLADAIAPLFPMPPAIQTEISTFKKGTLQWDQYNAASCAARTEKAPAATVERTVSCHSAAAHRRFTRPT